ncbi:MAG: CDP-alcohol phosphatidyltransferase family protein [Oscillospiraceae bacterium]
MRLIGFYDYTVILTYMSLVSAVLGMTFAHKGLFGAAMWCLFFSGFCDAFDGTVARTKKNRTEDEKAFGIQLDSLCDVVSFGVAPAFSLYCMGVDSTAGVVILSLFCICAVCRLGFFNVQEAKRQQVESGSNKYYRGLPVTNSAIIFPLYYLLHNILPGSVFVTGLYILAALTAFLFVLDFQVKKPKLPTAK